MLRSILTVVVALIIATGCERRSDGREQTARLAAKRAELAGIRARVATTPDDAAALYDLGSTLWAVGEMGEAEAALRRSVALDAKLEVVTELVALLDARGHYLEAGRWIHKIQAHRTSWPAWLTQLDEEYSGLMKRTELATLTSATEAGLNSLSMRLIEIPPAIFTRTIDGGWFARDTVVTVELSGYSIGQHEVTGEQFDTFMKETGYRGQPFVAGRFIAGRTSLPMSAVSWLDARAFTIWLSGREGAVYRLPTEAEWELAARGSAGYLNPWGNDGGRPQVDGNWGRTSSRNLKAFPPPTTLVGAFPRDRSPFGLLDMAGNVMEWCLDDYDSSYFEWAPSRDPYGPVGNSGVKVLRGGAWNMPDSDRLATLRTGAAVNQSYTGYGFRVVRETRRK